MSISKHKIVKLKLTLTLTDTRGAVLTIMLGYISKFYTLHHYMATPQKRLHRVTIRTHSQGLEGLGGPDRWSKNSHVTPWIVPVAKRPSKFNQLPFEIHLQMLLLPCIRRPFVSCMFRVSTS